MMDLNKHIVKNDDDKIMHSNGYASVSRGDRIGSTGNTSFIQRRVIDNNRRVVGNYRRSIVGNAFGVLTAKQVTPGDIKLDTNLRQNNTRPVVNPGQKRFNEPSSRPYNPYS